MSERASPSPVRDGSRADEPGIRRLQLRYGIVFGALSTALLFAYCFPYRNGGLVDSWLRGYLSTYTSVATAIVKLVDSTAQASGQQISGRFNMQIVRDCDAMEANILYFAAVCAYPATARMKVAGSILGVGVIGLANVVRLSLLYVVGMQLPKAFEFAHELAPPLIIFASLGVFCVWVAWTRRVLRASP